MKIHVVAHSSNFFQRGRLCKWSCDLKSESPLQKVKQSSDKMDLQPTPTLELPWQSATTSIRHLEGSIAKVLSKLAWRDTKRLLSAGYRYVYGKLSSMWKIGWKDPQHCSSHVYSFSDTRQKRWAPYWKLWRRYTYIHERSFDQRHFYTNFLGYTLQTSITSQWIVQFEQGQRRWKEEVFFFCKENEKHHVILGIIVHLSTVLCCIALYLHRKCLKLNKWL